MKYIFLLLFITLSNISVEAPNKSSSEIYIKVEEKEEEEVIDNYRIIRDLSLLHPVFRNKVVKFLYECKKEGIDLYVVETYRTPERQNMLRTQGHSMLKGGRSKHQYKIAVDVVPVKYGWYIWHNKKLWKKIGKIGEAQGLKWGGRWRKIYDPGHFEMPISIDEVESLIIPDTVLIPLNY